MPWAVIEHTNDDGDVTTHIVPFIPVENSFETEAEAMAFATEREQANDAVTDEDNYIIGIHKGHTLSPDCVCEPKPMDSDPSCYVHNAAN